MWRHVELLKKRYYELEGLLASSDLIPAQIAKLGKEYSELKPILDQIIALEAAQKELVALEKLINSESGDMIGLIREEIQILKVSIDTLTKKVQLALLPKDNNESRNVILEIRAGTGGEEAALFALDLLRMYMKYAQKKEWKIEIIDNVFSDQGGVSRAELLISGNNVYKYFKYESGVHRVQRVPVTESGGRLHTSAATVVVLPEAQAIDVKILDKDLRIDTYRSQGSGGQHVNTTDSAVRITHLPTNIVVQCQNERSQIKNREQAMKSLYTHLYDFLYQKQKSESEISRRNQVGSGDRSERIRTYNFPQGRLTDHRINLTLYKLESILSGDLDILIQYLQIADNAEKMSKNSN